jgi:hypothetical protein
MEHNKLDMNELRAVMERWAAVALTDGWTEQWVEGAIFPREMVFFMAKCESAGVVNVVESGRQDGYSTEVLGQYAAHMGGLVFSVDLDSERARADACRERLKGDPRLVLMRGNAMTLVGPLLRADPGVPTALLVDGPKGWLAMALLLAGSGFGWVRLLSMHNLEVTQPESLAQRRFFERLAAGPHFHEEVSAQGPNWQALTRAEEEWGRKKGAVRSLDRSSLGVAVLPQGQARRRHWTLAPRFGRYQPAALHLAWRLLPS